jgi:uncharacterized protein
VEFNLEVPLNQFFIRSVCKKGVRVNKDYFKKPFIISGKRIVPEWNIASVDDIDEESLRIVFDFEPEVVLIGTGNTQVFLPPNVQSHFFRRNIGFEVMTTDAACRTFNVLASEGRHVVGALLPLSP